LQEIFAIILLANINITGLQKLSRQLYSNDPALGPSVRFAAVCYVRLEIRSVERGVCPIATSTMNELFL